MFTKKQYTNILWFLIIVGEIIHFVLPFIHNPIDALWSDPGRWWEYATTMGIETTPISYMDPLFYQAWLSFIAKFTLDIPLLVAIYSGLLSAITPWLWYRFLRELLPTKQQALLGWAIFALLPSWIGIFSYFMTETLVLPLMGFALWMSWRSLRKRDFNSFMFANVIWVFATLTRAIIGPIAAVLMLSIWWYQKEKVKSIVSALVMTIFVLAFLTYRNYNLSGMIIPLGHDYLNSAVAQSGNRGIRVLYYDKDQDEDDDLESDYIFQSATVDYPIFYPFSNWISSRRGILKVNIKLDDEYESWQNALEKIENSNPPYLKLIWENVLLLLVGPSWPDMNEDYFFDILNIWSRFIWLPLFILSLYFLVKGIRNKQLINNIPLFSLLIFWFILQGLFLLCVNEGRYRKPVEGVIISSVLLGFTQKKKNSEFEGKSITN